MLDQQFSGSNYSLYNQQNDKYEFVSSCKIGNASAVSTNEESSTKATTFKKSDASSFTQVS